MRIPVDQALLDAVQHIAPVIQAYNQEAEHRGRLSKPVLTALVDASLFRLLTPGSSIGKLSTLNSLQLRVIRLLDYDDAIYALPRRNSS